MWKVEGSIPSRGCIDLYCVSGAQQVLTRKGWEVTANQLTPLSVAGCGQRQLGVAHWATSVALLQIVDT